MTEPVSPPPPAPSTAAADAPKAGPVHAPLQIPLATTLLRVAWMSIVLGLVVQGIVIAVQAAWPQAFLAELLGKITWSIFICTALAIASAASKASRGLVGLMGLLAAPAAVASARTVQKAVAGGMAGATTAAPAVAVVAPAPGAWEMAIAKAIQYAIFGWLICRAQKRGTLKAHLAVSVPIGVVFALYLAYRTWTTTNPAALNALSIAAKGVGDAAATIGCSVVLWAGVALAAKKAEA